MSAAPSRRRVSVFGTTGSIGCNTIDLLTRQGGAETYDVVALSGAGNVALLGRLEFAAPDLKRFAALAIARGVLEAGGLSGALFNAAKELASDLFLAGRIGFLAMADLVEATMERLAGHSKYGHTCYILDDVTEIDAETRRVARQLSGQ